MELVDGKDTVQMHKKDGTVVDCDVLFTFDSEDTMKSYVGYTDHTFSESGRKNIYVSSYDPFGPTVELQNITDEKELQMISEVLEQIDEESRNS